MAVLELTADHCCKCGTKLHHDTAHHTSDGMMCDGCYYGALGDLVEMHPIASPMPSSDQEKEKK